MQKPDRLLRSFPLSKALKSMKKLRKIILFHPDQLGIEIENVYCVCRKMDEKPKEKTSKLILCDTCFEWFHKSCIKLKDDFNEVTDEYKCDWCCSKVDKKGIQRWTAGRNKPKLRHIDDRPISLGVTEEGEHPQAYETPPSWEAMLRETRTRSKKITMKKKHLKKVAEVVVQRSQHHLSDTVAGGQVVQREVDDALVDDLVFEGLIEDVDME